MKAFLKCGISYRIQMQKYQELALKILRYILLLILQINQFIPYFIYYLNLIIFSLLEG